MINGLKDLKKLEEYWLNHIPLSVNGALRIVRNLGKEINALIIIKDTGLIVNVFIDKLKKIKNVDRKPFIYYLAHYKQFHSKEFELLDEFEFNLLMEVLL